LNVTPAAVGQLIRGLEETLGIELFHRSQTGPARLVLSEAARAAIPDLQAGFDRLATAVERLRAGKTHIAISVTVPPAFADKWLLPRVERFQTRYPAYDLRIDTSGRLVDFAIDRIDVGIRYGGGRWPGLQAAFLLRDEFFPVCSPSLLTGKHPLRSAQDLRHHPLIHDVSMAFESTFPTWRAWLQREGVTGIDSERGLRINDSAAVIQAVIAGNGVALGRTSLVERDLAEGRLVRPFGASLDYEFGYYIVSRPEAAAAAPVAAFRTWLLEEADSNP
jgi:LysR family glycine cleavage system transcriptional activator